MAKLKIKKGDKVVVIAGDDKGKEGEVTQVLPQKMQVVVSGVKTAKKAVKPTEQNKEGGFQAKEMPIDVSNVKKVEA